MNEKEREVIEEFKLNFLHGDNFKSALNCGAFNYDLTDAQKAKVEGYILNAIKSL